MQKRDIYTLLRENGIYYERAEHEAVYTIEGMLALNLPHSETVAKNLFLKDDKKNFYLLSVKEDRKINLKETAEKIGSRRLSFAKEEQLWRILGVISGAVTPLGVLNDKEKRVRVFIDGFYKNQLIGVHPLENTATVFLSENDLSKLIAPYCKSLDYINFE